MAPRRLASAFYFLYFAAAGWLIPYLNLYYQQIGLGAEQIGVLAALLTVTLLIAGPLWGSLADRFHLHRLILPLAMFATLLPVFLLAQTQSFVALLAVVFFFAAGLAPIIPVGDHAVLTMLGEQRYDYGKLRVWGAVGFGLAAWFSGVMAEEWGLGVIFWGYLAMMASGALAATGLPAPGKAAGAPFWANLHKLVTDLRWIGFLAAILMAGMGHAVLNNYLVLYMNALGAGEGLFGLSVAVAGLSELPVFVLAPLVLVRRPPSTLITIAFVALIVRLFLFAMMREPQWAIAVQLLHGLSFSAMWTAGVSYAHELAPVGVGASAQSLFGATLFGLAGSTGALFGGRVYAAAGPETLFLWAGFSALIGLGVFGLSEWRSRPAG